jgi:acyl dehydratase
MHRAADISIARVGDVVAELTLPPVNRTTLALFAGASGDHNPVHIDIDFAQNAGMPDVFAHGMLGMAWLARVVSRWVPQSRLRKLDARFLGITHLGQIITCSAVVSELLEIEGERCARLALKAVNQFGETTIGGEAVVALSERPTGSH